MNNTENIKSIEHKRSIKTFAAASFLNDMGSDMIYPIWPLFIRYNLGANMTILGILDGIGDAIVSLSQATSGYYSDKIKKRKLFVWIGYLMGSISRIGYAISTNWIFVLPFRILDRAGKIRSAPRDAIIADISTFQNRGKNFGILRAADNLGAVVGITICILLLETLSYSTIFLIAAVPSIVAVILILLFIHEKPAENIRTSKGIQLKELNNDLKLFLITSAVFSLGSFSYSFLLIYISDSGISYTNIPLLYLIFTFTAAVSSYPMGYFADKFGRKFIITFGYSSWILVCAGFIFFKDFILSLFLFVFYGIHKSALETAQKAFVSELAPENYKASSLGGFQMIVGLCTLPASLIAGLLWDNFGKNAPLILSIILSILALVLLGFVKEKNHKTENIQYSNRSLL